MIPISELILPWAFQLRTSASLRRSPPRQGSFSSLPVAVARRSLTLLVAGALGLAGCAASTRPEPVPGAFSRDPVAPTALVMAGLAEEAGGSRDRAVTTLREALGLAVETYGTSAPNTAFAHAALGLAYARLGRMDAALRHLRESRRIEGGRAEVFVNIAETRLPANANEVVARTLLRVRLERDLILCAANGGCTPSRVLGLADALKEIER